jgi:hypothetical protein
MKRKSGEGKYGTKVEGKERGKGRLRKGRGRKEKRDKG